MAKKARGTWNRNREREVATEIREAPLIELENNCYSFPRGPTHARARARAHAHRAHTHARARARAYVHLQTRLACFNVYRRLRNRARPWWNFHLLKQCPGRQARRVIVFALLC